MSPAGSVLAVVAHPDDAELWAGGTLAIHAQAGAPVTMVVPRTDDSRHGGCRPLYLPIIVDVTRTWEIKMQADDSGSG